MATASVSCFLSPNPHLSPGLCRCIARAPRRNPNVGGGWAGHDRRDLARLFAHRPTFVMFARTLRPERPRGAELNAEIDPELAAEYRLTSLWLEDFANGEAGWLSFLERRDRSKPER